MPEKKACSRCKKSKALEEFGPLKRSKDGRRNECKECVARASRDARAARRAAGVGPKPGKKARARPPVVVSLDERRPGGKPASGTPKRDTEPPTPRAWYPETPGPEPDTTWYATFLEHFAKNRSVTDACAEVGIHRSTFYAALARDQRFAEAAAWAKDESRDRVEKVAWERALDGWYEPVMGRVEHIEQGLVVGSMEPVATKFTYDAAMLRMILQGVAPEYRSNPGVAVQVNTQVGQPVKDPAVIDAGVAYLEQVNAARQR